MKIDKVVYTYFNPFRLKSSTGFNNVEDMMMFTALSVLETGQHFKEVEFNTDQFFAEIFDKIGLPMTITTDIEPLNSGLDPKLWAMSKIYSYSKQDKPFVHVDNDVILWKGLPKESDAYDFILQSKEELSVNKHYFESVYYYNKHIENKIPNFKYIDVAYNCGVCGMKDLDFVQKWTGMATNYVFNIDNYRKILTINDLGYYQNHFFEQYILAMLLQGQEDRLFLFGDTADKIPEEYRYTHYWASTKKRASSVSSVYGKMNRDYPKVIGRIKSILNEYKEKENLESSK